MRRATITLPDDLAEATENYLRAQEAPPALYDHHADRLREYLRERGFLGVHRPLKIRPAKRWERPHRRESRITTFTFTGLKK